MSPISTITFNAKVYIVEPGPGAPDNAIDPSGLSPDAQVDLHNVVASNIGGKRVKSFPSTEAGAKAIITALKKWKSAGDGVTLPVKAKAKAKAKKPAKKKKSAGKKSTSNPAKKKSAGKKSAGKKTAAKPVESVNFLGMRQDVTKSSDGIKDLVKNGTTIMRIRDLLLQDKGATQGQLEKVFTVVDAERKRKSIRDVRIRIYESVRQLTQFHGYGTKSEGGRIKLIS